MGTPLDSRPHLYDDLVEIFQGFARLTQGRGYNESGPQPIMYSEILAYMNEADIRSIDERRQFERLLRVLDGKYLTLAHDKMARERERLKNSSGSGKVRKR